MTAEPKYDPRDTPLRALALGAVAGVGATVVVSLLSRATFGTMDNRDRRLPRRRHPAEAITPGEALAHAAQAGPEGSAGKFAMKAAAGFFGRDISKHARAAGELVHFAPPSADVYCVGTRSRSSADHATRARHEHPVRRAPKLRPTGSDVCRRP